jgi:alkylhydroperoxidase family enzyme
MLGKMMSQVPQEVLDAIRAGADIPNARLQALAVFTKVMHDKRGNPTPEDVAAFLRAGFSEQHILAVVLAIAVKTLSNYSNHIFHTPTDTAFAAFAWKKPAAAGA